MLTSRYYKIVNDLPFDKEFGLTVGKTIAVHIHSVDHISSMIETVTSKENYEILLLDLMLNESGIYTFTKDISHVLTYFDFSRTDFVMELEFSK